MWFLADFGLVGLTALMGFLGWFFVKAWLAYRRAPESQQPLVLSLLLALAAMVGVAMGIEAFYQRHFWMIFALIASSYCLTLHPESAEDAASSSPGPPFRRARSWKDLRHRESEVLAHAY
jgi:O-antigen ligase